MNMSFLPWVENIFFAEMPVVISIHALKDTDILSTAFMTIWGHGFNSCEQSWGGDTVSSDRGEPTVGDVQPIARGSEKIFE